MDTSILYEQLVWALRPDILEVSVEAQKDVNKIYEILSDALDEAFEAGQNNEKDRHQWS